MAMQSIRLTDLAHGLFARFVAPRTAWAQSFAVLPPVLPPPTPPENAAALVVATLLFLAVAAGLALALHRRAS